MGILWLKLSDKSFGFWFSRDNNGSVWFPSKLQQEENWLLKNVGGLKRSNHWDKTVFFIQWQLFIFLSDQTPTQPKHCIVVEHIALYGPQEMNHTGNNLKFIQVFLSCSAALWDLAFTFVDDISLYFVCFTLFLFL